MTRQLKKSSSLGSVPPSVREHSPNRRPRRHSRRLLLPVLLWLLLFSSGYLYFFNVPKWVSITLLASACVKQLLDWAFTAWYRHQY